MRAASAGDTVGPYRLIKAIGAGGSARVDLACLDRAYGFQRRVVLKRPLEHLRGDARAHASLAREARICGRLAHPHLVGILDAGEHDGSLYLALEYVPGGSLRSLMQPEAGALRRPPLGVALAIAVDVARGLHHAHELRAEDGGPLGLVHRDVSPGNILIGADGAVKLADFGIAVETRLSTLSGSMHGTVAYMAPEQCRGHAFDRRADVFSLGVILYELVTGSRLFAADNDVATLHRVLSASVVPPHRLVGDLPLGLEDIILTAIAHEPERRFATAGDLADALEALAARAALPLTARAIARWVAAGAPAEPIVIPGASAVGQAASHATTAPGLGAASSHATTEPRLTAASSHATTTPRLRAASSHAITAVRQPQAAGAGSSNAITAVRQPQAAGAGSSNAITAVTSPSATGAITAVVDTVADPTEPIIQADPSASLVELIAAMPAVAPAPDFGRAATSLVPPLPPPHAAPKRTSRRTKVILAGVTAGIAAGIAVLALSRSPATATSATQPAPAPALVDTPTPPAPRPLAPPTSEARTPDTASDVRPPDTASDVRPPDTASDVRPPDTAVLPTPDSTAVPTKVAAPRPTVTPKVVGRPSVRVRPPDSASRTPDEQAPPDASARTPDASVSDVRPPDTAGQGSSTGGRGSGAKSRVEWKPGLILPSDATRGSGSSRR